jgi:type IV secretory pathway VirB2 component (pilin)
MLLNFKKIMVITLMIFSMNFVLSTNLYAGVGDQPATPGGTKPADVADAGQGIAQVLCNVIAVAQGATGKTIATLVIISMAIGLFLGKITWGVAIAVAVGMGVLFGANTVVSFVSSPDGKGTGDVCPKKS